MAYLRDTAVASFGCLGHAPYPGFREDRNQKVGGVALFATAGVMCDTHAPWPRSR